MIVHHRVQIHDNHSCIYYRILYPAILSINNMESGYIIKDNARIIARDVSNSNASSECICYRPHSNIICNGCGFWTRGRVRYCCPQHPKIVFLHDHAQCPRCRSYDFMLTEI